MSSFSKFLRITTLGLGMVTVATSAELGNISFIGDSITQGGGDTRANANSYRYSLWKCFVDNSVTYAPVGSMNKYFNAATTNNKAPNYMGQSFDNTSEGHYGWTTNQLLNGRSGGNSGNGKASDWIAALQTNGKVPDTITFMIGVNDLSQKANTSKMLDDLGKVIQAYQGANPNVNVHVFSVLPTNQTWQTQNGYTSSDAYNTMLESKVGEWNKGNSKVVYNDVRAGFSPVSHNVSDGVHPNEQGNLIIAGNMARALGIEQRTMGLERKGASSLTTQISFPTVSGSPPTQKDNNVSINGNAGNWTFSSTTTASLATNKTVSSLQGLWDTASGSGEFTLDFSLSLQSKNDSSQYFSAWIGNGVSLDGMLQIFENKVSWGHNSKTVLYEADMTDAFHDFRIVYMNASLEGGITAGYSIWLDGQLIGEGLQGDVAYKNDRFLLGTYTVSATCYADVKNIAYDNQKAYAPSSGAVPEPGVSMLTLAGLGMLAFRRRKA